MAAAIGIALLGGFGVRALGGTGLFADPLKAPAAKASGCGSCCGGSSATKAEAPVWRFWQDGARRRVFATSAGENALFLAKWLFLAYLAEAVMLRHVPAETIAGLLGGEGVGTIVLAAALGGPAYLNGYAALPLVGGLIEQGMSPGAGMAFVLAGGVSCIPAAIAVWALVKPRVFAAYLGFAFVGSVAAGLTWNLIA
ncbi:MAG: permease [Paracoccaceae bacterium]